MTQQIIGCLVYDIFKVTNPILYAVAACFILIVECATYRMTGSYMLIQKSYGGE